MCLWLEFELGLWTQQRKQSDCVLVIGITIDTIKPQEFFGFLLSLCFNDYEKALNPVTSIPVINKWISCVPCVITDSKFIMWRIIGYSPVIPIPPCI